MENTKDKKILRAVVYTRVSSDEQTRGYGLEYQLEECKKMINNNEHELTRVYSDPGISGTIEDRPELNAMRADAREGKFNILYFWKSDRLARDEILQLTLYREFEGHGVETLSVTEPKMNRLMKGIYAVFGGEDLRNLTARMYQGRILSLRAGNWIGPVPFGLSKEEKKEGETTKKTGKLILNMEQAKIVRKIFEWFVNSRLSLTALCNRLNREKVPTYFDSKKKKKYRYGYGFWSKGAVSRILNREYYATGTAWFHKYMNSDKARFGNAKLRPKEDWIGVPVPSIISVELYEAAQKQLLCNKVYARRKTKRDYLFAKKLICGTCRMKLTANCRTDREDAKFYRGDAWSEKRCAECRYYLESDLETPIWDGIVSFFQNPGSVISELGKYRERGSKRQDVLQQQAELKKSEDDVFREEKILLDYDLKGLYDQKVLEEKRKEIEKQKRDIEERRRELNKVALMEERRAESIKSAEDLYEKIRGQLDAATYEIRRRVFSLLIDKVTLEGQSAEVQINVPAQVAFSYFINSIFFETLPILLRSTPLKKCDTNANSAALSPILLRSTSYKKCDTKVETLSSSFLRSTLRAKRPASGIRGSGVRRTEPV